MSSIFSGVVLLLQSALSLLGVVQQNPNLPPATQAQAVQTAQQAISAATTQLNGATASQQSTTAVQTASHCAEFAQLKEGDTDQTTGGLVSQLQRLVGAPVTGYYGARTNLAYQNSCVGGNSQPTSVAGMSKYTDSTFGFTFWYPSSGVVTSYPAGSYYNNKGWTGNQFSESMYGSGTQVVQTIVAPEFTIDEVDAPSASILSSVDPGCCGSEGDKYYFDSSAGEWMYFSDGAPTGKNAGTSVADISKNTMGGLHIFQGYTRFGIKVIVPLSATHFLAIYSRCNDATDYGCDWSSTAPTSGLSRFNDAVQTIVATDPSVAQPLPTSQQLSIVQQEASAYGTAQASSN